MKTSARLLACLTLSLLASTHARAFDTVLPPTVRLWELRPGATPEPKAPLAGHTKDITAIAYSPDGALLATASADDAIILWQVATGEKVGELGHPSGHTAPVTSIAFSPDGLLLVSGGEDGLIKIWDIRDRTKVPITINDYRGRSVVTSVAYCKDGRFASATGDGVVALWDSAGGKADTPILLTGAVYALAFSPDGKMLVVAGEGGMVKVWDLAARRFAQTLAGHKGAVTSLSFSADGKTLATGSEDDTVKLWNPLVGGDALRTLTGHAGSVTSVAFGRGGQLASGAWDGTIRLWNAQTGAAEGVLPDHVYRVTALAFSPDGRRLASGSIYPDELSNPRLFILSIGVGEYAAPLKLPFATAGAQRVAELLEKGGRGMFAAVSKVVLLNSQVTQEGLDAAFREIAGRAGRQDVFVFYYVGRRTVVPGAGPPQFYLAPSSVSDIRDAASLAAHGISADRLKDWLDSMPAQRQLVLVDSSDLSEADGKSFLERVRGNLKQPAPSPFDRPDKRDLFMMSLSLPEDGQDVRDLDGHMPFTHFTLFGLAGAADQPDPKTGKGDREITTKELYEYLYSKLEALTDPPHNFINRKWGRPFSIMTVPEKWRGNKKPISDKSKVTRPLRRGRSYALLIATSRYDDDDEADGLDNDNGWDPLPNTITDAEKIAKLLVDDYGFEKAEILKDADYRTILAKIEEYEEMPHGPDDQLLLYFAGHGDKDKRKEGYIVPRDGRYKDSAYVNYLRYTELRNRLDGVEGEEQKWWRHVLVILDVCYGGYFDPRRVKDRGDKNPTDGEEFDASIITASPQQIVDEKMPHIVRRYIASGAQTVKEGFPGGVSPFTKSLLIVLSKKRWDGGILRGEDLVGILKRMRMEIDPVSNDFGKDEVLGDFIFFVK